MQMPTPPAAPRRRTVAIVAVEAGLGLRDYARRVWKHSNDDDLLFLASGISFDLLLAIVPFALLIISGLGYFLNTSPDASVQAVVEVVGRFLPAGGVKGGPLEIALHDIIRTRGSVGVVSAVTFLWFSTRLFASLRSALDRVFGFMHERRHVIAGKWLDIRITIYTTLLIVAWTSVSAFLSIVRTFSMPKRGAASLLDTATYLGGRVFAIVVFVSLFWSLYRYLPSRKLRPRTALVAATWTTGMFELARYLFAAYVLALDPASLYTSTLRAVVVVMFWIYYAGIIFTLGGEIGRVFELRRAERLGHDPWM